MFERFEQNRVLEEPNILYGLYFEQVAKIILFCEKLDRVGCYMLLQKTRNINMKLVAKDFDVNSKIGGRIRPFDDLPDHILHKALSTYSWSIAHSLLEKVLKTRNSASFS
jgi:hypothetical protein